VGGGYTVFVGNFEKIKLWERGGKRGSEGWGGSEDKEF